MLQHMIHGKCTAFTVVFALTLTLFSGCRPDSSPPFRQSVGNDTISTQVFSVDPVTDSDMTEKDLSVRRAVWISYLDLQKFDWSSDRAFRASVKETLDNLMDLSITDVIVQVRAFGEAIYPSDLFPSAEFIYGPIAVDDPLAIFLKEVHARDMRFHAWMNPYRLSRAEAMQPYLSQLRKQDASLIWESERGVFLNPSSEEAEKRVVDGVRELLERYDVDGIHLDDYFYPTDEETLDELLYAAYVDNGGNMSLSDFRRYRVSSMIAALYDLIKEHDESIEFGVSPDASVTRNRTVHYADVQLWGAAEGYIDYLCPQIYYGFENETMPFQEVVKTWQSVCIHCDLWVGLAFYKTGVQDDWAGNGSEEWIQNNDLMARQYQFLTQQGCKTVVFYRYNSIFFPEVTSEAAAIQERENLIDVVREVS